MREASDYAVGAVLGQKKEGQVHAVYYACKTLNEAQLNYATTEKELLVVVFSIMNSKVIVYTVLVRNMVPTLTSRKRRGLSLNGRC
jgi:hypothetical protein